MRGSAMLAAGLAAALAGCGGSVEDGGGEGEEAGEMAAAASRWRAGEVTPESPRVRLDTSRGEIVIALFPDESPATVENFLAYVREGFYDGLVFHRVIPGFMVQGGGFTAELRAREPGRPPIRNEGANGLGNFRGTVAMARTNDPHSASAQFFINQVDNEFLNHEARGAGQWGYAVFGLVVEGLEVVDSIAAVETDVRAGSQGPMQDVPREAVVIRRVIVVGS